MMMGVGVGGHQPTPNTYPVEGTALLIACVVCPNRHATMK